MAKASKAVRGSKTVRAPGKAVVATAKPAPVIGMVPPDLTLLAGMHELSVPIINSSAFQASTNGSEMLVALLAPKLYSTVPSGAPVSGMSQTVAVISMSAQGCKDLSLMLTVLVEKYEKEFGVLETQFTKRLAAEHVRRKKSH